MNDQDCALCRASSAVDCHVCGAPLCPSHAAIGSHPCQTWGSPISRPSTWLMRIGIALTVLGTLALLLAPFF